MVAIQNTADSALQMLLKARDEQAVVVARETGKLNQLEDAIRALQDSVVVEGIPVMQDMKHMGITDGAKQLIEENKGQPLSTSEIAKQLKARGVQTKSKNWIPTVYATLANNSMFIRVAGKWGLKRTK